MLLAKVIGIALGLAVVTFGLLMAAPPQPESALALPDVVIVCSGGAPCRPLRLPVTIARPSPIPTQSVGPTPAPTPSPAPMAAQRPQGAIPHRVGPSAKQPYTLSHPGPSGQKFPPGGPGH